MKRLLLIALLFGLGKVYAQRNSDYSDNPPANSYNNSGRTSSSAYNRGSQTKTTKANKVIADNDYDQIRIVDSTQEIRADILPFKSDPKIKNDRYYFWYLNNIIHSTQGGYNGQLLNGHYISFYPDKNLKEEGYFKRGLKDGQWKNWNQKGDLVSVINWSEGVQQSDTQQPFWKKVPFLNKKNDQQQQPAEKPDGNQ